MALTTSGDSVSIKVYEDAMIPRNDGLPSRPRKPTGLDTIVIDTV